MEQLNFNNTEIAFQYKSNKALNNTFFVFRLIQNPLLVKVLTQITYAILKLHLPLKWVLKNTVYKVFCAGANRAEAAATMQHLAKYKVQTVMDYVAEGDNDPSSFEKNYQTILANIQFLAQHADKAVLAVKLSGLEDVSFLKKFKKLNDAQTLEDQNRLNALLEKMDCISNQVKSKGLIVYYDAEEYSTQSLFDDLVEKMMMKHNQDRAVVYNTLQMYLCDRIPFLKNCISHAEQHQYVLGIKLVRGAYVEKERIYAANEGRTSPVFSTKEATDASFDEAVAICLDHADKVHTCIATHNQESVQKACLKLYSIKDKKPVVAFSQLYGMSDHLSFNLAYHGFKASKYVPYGEVEKAIPYLLRRAEENTSLNGQMSREYSLLKKEIQRRKQLSATVS